MFNDVTKYVDTLCQLNITANQFLLCYLIYTDSREDGKLVRKGKSIANIYKYVTANKGAIKWTKEESKDLVDKGYLIDPYYKSDKSYPDYFEVTDKFKDAIFASKSRFDQFYDKYPPLIENFNNPKGPMIKLKVCDKDKLRDLYNRKVKTKVLHNKILTLLDWAIENKQLNTNIQNFVSGELWDTYQAQMDRYEETSNMNIAR